MCIDLNIFKISFDTTKLDLQSKINKHVNTIYRYEKINTSKQHTSF